MRTAALALRFALELALLGALVYAGVRLAGGFAGWALGLLAAAAAGVVWGLFISPRARHRVPTPARLAIEAGLFAVAVAGLLAAGHPVLAVILGALYLAHRLALRASGAPAFEPPSDRG